MQKIVVMLVAFSVLCGCTPFGTFSNLERGKTKKEAVRSMLGKPAEKLFKNDREVWEYHFVKRDKKKAGKLLTILNLEIIFKEDEVDNYNVSVSKKSVEADQEKVFPERKPLPPPREPRPRRRPFFEDLYNGN